MVGPPLSGGGDVGRACANGARSGGAAGMNSTANACITTGGTECARASATNIGVAQGFAAGVEWRWQGGRSDEEDAGLSHGMTAHRATHWTFASRETSAARTTGTFRQRIPAIRIQQAGGALTRRFARTPLQ